MKQRCPITYETVARGKKYSRAGLLLLSPRLTHLSDLPFTAAEQRLEATKRARKMSIQGLQPKLSARLSVRTGSFNVVDTGGVFILKPQHADYPQMPENEDLTMRLAATADIEVPLHGMLWSKDGSLTYFIRRFDRVGRNKKVAVEDFAQLSGNTRRTKYDFTMERVANLVETFCTFPLVEKKKLFLRTLFNFVVGNEDMHLKNFSVIVRDDVVQLAPAYDFLNTTVLLGGGDLEELALPLNGKKRNLKRKHLVDYWGRERLGLTSATVDEVLHTVASALRCWPETIEQSFLAPATQQLYYELITKRASTLSLNYSTS